MATEPILSAWLTAIARDGWSGARIDAVADIAGVAAGDVAVVHSDRWSALDAFQRDLDVAALADAGADRGATVRDRLFALLMARFDAAQAHKATLRVLAGAMPRDPGLAAFALAHAPRSVARVADAAGVDTGGWLGPLRVHALVLLVAQVARTWLNDDDADLAATMMALDGALERAERWALRMSSRATGSPAAPAPSDDPAAG